MLGLRWSRGAYLGVVLLEAAGLVSSFSGYGGQETEQIHLAKDSDPNLGAVASENDVCSRIGTHLLHAGGNAADAVRFRSSHEPRLIIGIACRNSTLCGRHCGLGGGGFILVRDKHGSYEFIDARETAPAAATEDMYKFNLSGSVHGGLSSGVPGELRGLEYLHTKYGSLPWRDVLAPAIHVARDGFNVSHDLLKYMQASTQDYDFLTHEPEWAVDFAPNGTRVGLGDVMTRKRYARTLQSIAEQGADIFYTGNMAKATIRAIQGQNGIMTLNDLRGYTIESRRPLEIDYREFRVVSCGAPSSGAVVSSALKTVEGYRDIGDWTAINTSTHRLDEAIRFAYGERGRLGDPAFVPSSREHEMKMLDEKHAQQKRYKISDAHTLNVSDYDPEGYEIRNGHGTSHIVSADVSGMAVSMTTSLNLIFGSRVLVPETGVIMNDHMNDFSVPNRKNEFGYRPSPSNYIRGKKRPMSSMTPVIVEHRQNGSLYYVIGAAGGSRIPTAIIQNLWHVLDHRMNLSASLAMPRFHDQLLPNIIGFEWTSGNSTGHNHPDGLDNSDGQFSERSRNKFLPMGSESGIGTGYVHGYDNDTVKFMQSRGHNVSWVPPGYSSAQALRLLWNGTFEAAGEPRQADSAGFAV